MYEVVRPLVSLLQTDRDGMQNFEALRGLTNLAGFSEKLRYCGKSSGIIRRLKGHFLQLSDCSLQLFVTYHLLFLCRVKIVKEKALPEIENYMFEDHEQIRQAATECMCNLVSCKEVREDMQLQM